MTSQEAQAIIALFATAYENQSRSPAFMRLLASELARSGVSFETMKARSLEWIRTEKFWPGVSDLVSPVEPEPVRLLPPPKAIPQERGIAILKGTT